jgi:hypothetical protein
MSADFLLICEVGMGNYTVNRFNLESEARVAAAKLWCCWVLYRNENSNLTEIEAGGVGFAAPAIRRYAEREIRSKARDATARASAAAAAEARAAKLTAQQPKKKAAATPATNDGRPDVSNPATWD